MRSRRHLYRFSLPFVSIQLQRSCGGVFSYVACSYVSSIVLVIPHGEASCAIVWRSRRGRHRAQVLHVRASRSACARSEKALSKCRRRQRLLLTSKRGSSLRRPAAGRLGM